MREIEVRRWTREEYQRMGEAGILGPEERVELIDGEIVRMTAQGGRHARAICAAEEAVRKTFGEGCHVRVQLPLGLDPVSEPEPDISVVAGHWQDYAGHPPSAVLIVEIADTTLSFDRGRKASLYARARVPEYWIVNLSASRLEVHRDPVSSETAPYGWAYHTVRHLGPGQRIAPMASPASEIAVDDLLA